MVSFDRSLGVILVRLVDCPGVHSGYSCADRGRWVRSDTFLVSSGSWFIQARPSGRSVLSGAPWWSYGSFDHAQGVVFIRARWVH